MATQTKDVVRKFLDGRFTDLPVIAADIIYEGAAVGDNASGYMRPLVAGDPFRGFAHRKVDNAAGSAGDKDVRLDTKGAVQLSVATLAIDDVGKPVYASDDNTFVLTESTNSYIGRVTRFISAGVGVVEFDATKGAHGTLAELTDSSGGTASGTIAAISGTYVQAEVANGFASLTAKINSIARMIE